MDFALLLIVGSGSTRTQITNGRTEPTELDWFLQFSVCSVYNRTFSFKEHLSILLPIYFGHFLCLLHLNLCWYLVIGWIAGTLWFDRLLEPCDWIDWFDRLLEPCDFVDIKWNFVILCIDWLCTCTSDLTYFLTNTFPAWKKNSLYMDARIIVGRGEGNRNESTPKTLRKQSEPRNRRLPKHFIG